MLSLITVLCHSYHFHILNISNLPSPIVVICRLPLSKWELESWFIPDSPIFGLSYSLKCLPYAIGSQCSWPHVLVFRWMNGTWWAWLIFSLSFVYIYIATYIYIAIYSYIYHRISKGRSLYMAPFFSVLWGLLSKTRSKLTWNYVGLTFLLSYQKQKAPHRLVS